jgi:hypothetical protein
VRRPLVRTPVRSPSFQVRVSRAVVAFLADGLTHCQTAHLEPDHFRALSPDVPPGRRKRGRSLSILSSASNSRTKRARIATTAASTDQDILLPNDSSFPRHRCVDRVIEGSKRLDDILASEIASAVWRNPTDPARLSFLRSISSLPDFTQLNSVVDGTLSLIDLLEAAMLSQHENVGPARRAFLRGISALPLHEQSERVVEGTLKLKDTLDATMLSKRENVGPVHEAFLEEISALPSHEQTELVLVVKGALKELEDLLKVTTKTAKVSNRGT